MNKSVVVYIAVIAISLLIKKAERAVIAKHPKKELLEPLDLGIVTFGFLEIYSLVFWFAAGYKSGYLFPPQLPLLLNLVDWIPSVIAQLIMNRINRDSIT